MTRDQVKERLQSDHQAKVDQGEYTCHRAIQQNMVDQHVDVVQSIPQNREPNDTQVRVCRE